MKKTIRTLNIIIFLILMISEVGNAGMINYDRRNKRRGVPSPAAAPKSVIKEEPKDPIQGLLASEHEISSRVEKIYDTNKDGKLQKDEILEFLTDVVSSIKRRGRSSVNSSLLEPFDKNKDGVISRYEVGDIEKYLN